MDLSVSSLLYASAEDKSTYGPGRSLISFKSIQNIVTLTRGLNMCIKKGAQYVHTFI